MNYICHNCHFVIADAHRITLDSNTAHRLLKLSVNKRAVTVTSEQQPYLDHPERFDHWQQLLCTDGLTGRHFWEVTCEGMVCIGVTYKGISRKEDGPGSLLGGNDQSWSLHWSGKDYTAFHNNKKKHIHPPSSTSTGVGVYLDWPSGTLSFYSVSSDASIHLHTFRSKFTEPVYPAFRVGIQKSLFKSSVSLCELKKYWSNQ